MKKKRKIIIKEFFEGDLQPIDVILLKSRFNEHERTILRIGAEEKDRGNFLNGKNLVANLEKDFEQSEYQKLLEVYIDLILEAYG